MTSASGITKHPDPECRGLTGIDRRGIGEAGTRGVQRNWRMRRLMREVLEMPEISTGRQCST